MILSAVSWEGLHSILRELRVEMMPLCGNMIGMAKGMAALGALFYVAYRIWRSLAAAEPIDVFPLLRPIVLCILIVNFQTLVIGTFEGILKPVTTGTGMMVQTEKDRMQEMLTKQEQKEKDIMMSSPETAYLVDDDAYEKKINEFGKLNPERYVVLANMTMDRSMYRMKKNIRRWFNNILEAIYHAAALCIDTIRTFFLIVLTILGPISFALSVYDGFTNTLTS